MKYYSAIMIAVLLGVIVGCGKGYVPMGGTVTFSDDGSPLTKGTVIFDTGVHHARGELNAQGQYTLSFDKPGSGLPKGTYGVYVTDALVPDGTVASPDSSGSYERPKYKNLIDPKFHSAATSELKFDVDGTKKTFDFKVDRAKN